MSEAEWKGRMFSPIVNTVIAAILCVYTVQRTISVWSTFAVRYVSSRDVQCGGSK